MNYPATDIFGRPRPPRPQPTEEDAHLLVDLGRQLESHVPDVLAHLDRTNFAMMSTEIVREALAHVEPGTYATGDHATGAVEFMLIDEIGPTIRQLANVLMARASDLGSTRATDGHAELDITAIAIALAVLSAYAGWARHIHGI